tara:strand:+ start:872 stop:1474 length:603 start_codon:yes stop_codon:yes gene_type:complete
MFITFEGIDGSGKTTQVELLKLYFENLGKTVLTIRDPGSTLISEKIRNILLDSNNLSISPQSETLLFTAARAQIVHEVIKPSLEKSKIVICDRFIDSTSAYQGYGRDMNLVNIGYLNKFAMQGVHPNFTFFIDISTQESTNRLNKSSLDRMELAGNDFYEKVRAGYIDLVKNFPERIFRIDGSLPINDIHSKIINIIKGK